MSSGNRTKEFIEEETREIRLMPMYVNYGILKPEIRRAEQSWNCRATGKAIRLTFIKNGNDFEVKHGHVSIGSIIQLDHSVITSAYYEVRIGLYSNAIVEYAHSIFDAATMLFEHCCCGCDPAIMIVTIKEI